MSEKDIERDARASSEMDNQREKKEAGRDLDDTVDSSVSNGNDAEEDVGFAPIRSTAPSRPRTPNSARSRSLSRARSNNGYGVDDLDEYLDDVPRDPETDKDPFEVGWDGGDSDPLCPRSKSLWRKWLIVVITSFGSFCVYVFISVFF